MNLFQKSKQIKKLPFLFIDNDTKITDKKDIANKFNNYFTNIGQSITQGIKYKGSKKYSYYLNKNVTSTFTFDHIDEENHIDFLCLYLLNFTSLVGICLSFALTISLNIMS